MKELLYMAMPPPEVRDALLSAISPLVKDSAKLFPPNNWHQSLSDKHIGDEGLLRRLRNAGGRVRADAFALTFDRVQSQGAQWALRAKAPPTFLSLLTDLRAAMHAEGIADEGGHTAHITVDYRADTTLSLTRIEPIHWVVDEFRLVQAKHHPYRYEVVDRWRLNPCAEAPPAQMSFL